MATRFSYSLVPLGFGMWLAHYGFHFLTSYATVIPTCAAVCRATWAGRFSERPSGPVACCGPVVDWLPRLEILFLDVGLLLTLHTGYRISLGLTERPVASAEGVRALGAAEPAPIRCRNLDRAPADADARHHARNELSSAEPVR